MRNAIYDNIVKTFGFGRRHRRRQRSVRGIYPMCIMKCRLESGYLKRWIGLKHEERKIYCPKKKVNDVISSFY